MHLRSTKRKAAKVHRCVFCEGWIEVGEIHIDGFSLFEGFDPNPWRAHLDCQILANKYCDAIGEYCPEFQDIDQFDYEIMGDYTEIKIEIERLIERGQKNRHVFR